MKVRRILLLLLSAVSLLLLVPLVASDLPPLHDYPNHLARIYVILHLEESPILQRYYEIQWEVLPNLAMDIVVPILANVVSLEVAGKIFCALVLLTTVPAVAMLHYALYSRLSLWPLLASLFVYNYVFIFGFLNYLIGVNMALAGVALWIWFRKLSWSRSAALFSAYSTVLFFTHLYALCLYAAVLFGYEISRQYQARDTSVEKARTWTIAAGQFLLPAGLFLFASPTFSENLNAVAASSFWSKVGAVYSIFNTGDPGKDGFFFLFSCAALVGAAVSGRVKLHRDLRLSLLFLSFCFLIMPGALFGSGYADYRLPWAIFLLWLAGSQWMVPGEHWKRVVLVVGMIMLVLRMGQLSIAWYSFNDDHREVMSAIRKIPAGAKVFSYVLPGEKDSFSTRPPLDHLATLAVIHRSAFVPTLFAFPGKHPVRLTPEYRRLAAITPHPNEVSAATWKSMDSPDHPLRPQVAANYEFLLLFAPPPLRSGLPSFCTRVAEWRKMALFRIGRVFTAAEPAEIRERPE